MSQQALDLRRSVQIVRRHKVLVGIVVVLGLLAGGAYAALHPPMLTSTALVVLPQDAQIRASRAAQDGRQQALVRSMPIRPPKWWLQAVIRCFRARCRMSVRPCRSRSCAAKFRSEALPLYHFGKRNRQGRRRR